MSDKYNFDNYKKDTLTRPRDMAWDNWKSWKDSSVGDKVQGYVADAFYRPEEVNPDGSVAFRSQRGITIKLADGTFMNVGVKDLDFVLVATDKLRVGDPITVELEKVLQAKSKGKNGAKVFAYYGANLPENAGNKTIKQLTDEDKAEGGTKEAAPEAARSDEEGSTEDVDLDQVADEFTAGAEGQPQA